MSGSPAVAVARAHVEAWSNHDYDAARSARARRQGHGSEHRPRPAGYGADWCRGLHARLVAFADPIVPGSLRVLGGVGDECNALLMLTAQLSGAPMGAKATLSGARPYLLDDDGKIRAERVIFCVTAA
jgi:hypothetical protein